MTISAGWTTNGVGDRYTLRDEINLDSLLGKERDVWGVKIDKYESCAIANLLSNSKYDMLVRHILSDGFKITNQCKYALKRGIRSIFVGNYEYRSTSTTYSKRPCKPTPST